MTNFKPFLHSWSSWMESLDYLQVCFSLIWIQNKRIIQSCPLFLLNSSWRLSTNCTTVSCSLPFLLPPIHFNFREFIQFSPSSIYIFLCPTKDKRFFFLILMPSGPLKFFLILDRFLNSLPKSFNCGDPDDRCSNQHFLLKKDQFAQQNINCQFIYVFKTVVILWKCFHLLFFYF